MVSVTILCLLEDALGNRRSVRGRVATPFPVALDAAAGSSDSPVRIQRASSSTSRAAGSPSSDTAAAPSASSASVTVTCSDAECPALLHESDEFQKRSVCVLIPEKCMKIHFRFPHYTHTFAEACLSVIGIPWKNLHTPPICMACTSHLYEIHLPSVSHAFWWSLKPSGVCDASAFWAS